MRFLFQHETVYAYERDAAFSAQIVRLFARPSAGLEVVKWIVRAPEGVLTPHLDGLGNLSALRVRLNPRGADHLVVEAEVNTVSSAGFSLPQDRLPLDYWLRATPRTAADQNMRAYAENFGPDVRFERLAEAARDYVGTHRCAFGGDPTLALTALARYIGLPTRYASGYRFDGPGSGPVGCAWAEIWRDGVWLGLDAVRQAFIGERYVRLAAGLDYDQSAPVTGVRRGGGAETLTVRMDVLAGAGQ